MKAPPEPPETGIEPRGAMTAEQMVEWIDTHPALPLTPDTVSVVTERERQIIDRLTRALRVNTHTPHDQAGDPVEGFPTCSGCGAILTSAPPEPPDGPDLLASAMSEAFTYEDRDNGVPTLPFTDDLEGFWRPFAVKVLAAIEPARIDCNALMSEVHHCTLRAGHSGGHRHIFADTMSTDPERLTADDRGMSVGKHTHVEGCSICCRCQHRPHNDNLHWWNSVDDDVRPEVRLREALRNVIAYADARLPSDDPGWQSIRAIAREALGDDVPEPPDGPE